RNRDRAAGLPAAGAASDPDEACRQLNGCQMTRPRISAGMTSVPRSRQRFSRKVRYRLCPREASRGSTPLEDRAFRKEEAMQSEPQKEHRWLEKLVGDWTYESEAAWEPGKTPEKYTGTESVRSLGGLWVICEGQGDVPGGGTS